jgi:hypothetical protein
MKCREADRFFDGEIVEPEFARHAAGCPRCAAALGPDEEFDALVRALRRPVQAPGLWDRIEEALRAEKSRERRLREEMRSARRVRRLRFAAGTAVVAVGVALALFFGPRSAPEPPTRGLLSRAALARVERAEREYVKAIESLERQTSSRMAGLDRDLASLYRERLETIDAQIRDCREALASNPANAHIRRYLLAALGDKEKTLTEVQSLGSNSRRSS